MFVFKLGYIISYDVFKKFLNSEKFGLAAIESQQYRKNNKVYNS